LDKKDLLKILALIDLGTVSVRFEIYSVSLGIAPPLTTTPYHTQQLFRERHMLRLGTGLYFNHRLNEAGKQLTRQTFLHFKNKLEEFGPLRVCAVATSALREAEDGPMFVEELAQLLGYPMTIITGEEEAYLVARGILANEAEMPEHCALIDIGGGSTEVSVCHRKEILHSASLRLGAIRCQQLFLKTSPPAADSANEGISALRMHIKEQLKTISSFRPLQPIAQIIGSSGTVRTLCRLRLDYQHQPGVLSAQSLHQLVKQLSLMSVSEIAQIPGMEANRADIILAGTLILEELVDFFGASEVQPSLFSLRYGLLDREIERCRG
jgi:exopolyphosphatase / guanosine-5'-triphosphate,3'-diphosphate pyrophosphatase